MSELQISSYKLLFELRLLHHFWLDDGSSLFDILSSAKQKERLRQYDFRKLVRITPTPATAKSLRRHEIIFKETSLGAIVATPANAAIPLNAAWEFEVVVISQEFYTYTAPTLQGRKITEIYDASENRIRRFKENVPVLSNEDGASRGSGSTKQLYLSRPLPTAAPNWQAEWFLDSGGQVRQFVGDEPETTFQVVGTNTAATPVFVHQEDAPPLTAPAWMSGLPPRGIELTDGLSDEVFCLIRIIPQRPSDTDFNIVDGTGKPLSKHPVFQVRLKNRSTYWRYIKKSTGVLDSAETNPLPLTYFGNSGTRQKPAIGIIKAEKNGAAVTKLISEAFI